MMDSTTCVGVPPLAEGSGNQGSTANDAAEPAVPSSLNQICQGAGGDVNPVSGAYLKATFRWLGAMRGSCILIVHFNSVAMALWGSGVSSNRARSGVVR